MSEFFCNECNRSTPLDPKMTFWCVSYYLGAFGTVWLPYESRCTTGQSSAKVRATKSRRNISQQTHPINPIRSYTDVIGTVWFSYETWCKTGRTCAKVRAMKSRQNFWQLTHPIHPIRPKTNILVHLGAFGTVWLPYET